jgi:hypothetical protein
MWSCPCESQLESRQQSIAIGVACIDFNLSCGIAVQLFWQNEFANQPFLRIKLFQVLDIRACTPLEGYDLADQYDMLAMEEIEVKITCSFLLPMNRTTSSTSTRPLLILPRYCSRGKQLVRSSCKKPVSHEVIHSSFSPSITFIMWLNSWVGILSRSRRSTCRVVQAPSSSIPASRVHTYGSSLSKKDPQPL